MNLDLHTITSLLGLVVAVAGILAVLYQLRQVERGLRSSASGAIYEMASRIKEVFLENPELRPYFLDGEPISPDHESYPRALVLADYYCLYLELITTQGENIAEPARGTWYRYVQAIYASSPIIRDYLRDKRDWYTPAFWSLVEHGTAPSSTPRPLLGRSGVRVS